MLGTNLLREVLKKHLIVADVSVTPPPPIRQNPVFADRFFFPHNVICTSTDSEWSKIIETLVPFFLKPGKIDKSLLVEKNEKSEFLSTSKICLRNNSFPVSEGLVS